jgi:hypothetical protein
VSTLASKLCVDRFLIDVPDDEQVPNVHLGAIHFTLLEQTMKPNRGWLAAHFCALVSAALLTPPALAQSDHGDRHSPQEVMSNWNTAACEMTDTSAFQLDGAVRAVRVEVWYRWHKRESSVAYTLTKDGRPIRDGILRRGDCDPYQEKWCVATDMLDLRLRSGNYAIRTERSRVCQNAESGGNGFVRLYGSPL